MTIGDVMDRIKEIKKLEKFIKKHKYNMDFNLDEERARLKELRDEPLTLHYAD